MNQYSTFVTTNLSTSSRARYTNTTSRISTTIKALLSLPTLTPSSSSSSTNRTAIVATADPALVASRSDIHPSTTIGSASSVTVGAVDPAALFCGIHGLPVGDYFLAEFVEKRAGVPITLLGCYQFCIVSLSLVLFLPISWEVYDDGPLKGKGCLWPGQRVIELKYRGIWY